MDSHQLLTEALALYARSARRCAALFSDGPDDGGPGWAYGGGRSWLLRRLEGEPFTLDETTRAAFEDLARPLTEAHGLDEELELFEGFPSRVIALLERRRRPVSARTGGRRWIDQHNVPTPVPVR